MDELLGLTKVTVVNYREIDGALFLKLKMKSEVMECPNCHKELEDINQIEYNLVRDLSLLGKKVYLEVPRRQFHCEKCQKYIGLAEKVKKRKKCGLGKYGLKKHR